VPAPSSEPALVTSLYAIPTWTRTARLIAEHAALQNALGGAPSEWACYRFATKLREHKPMLDACLSRVLASLAAEVPEYGVDVAIDGSDLPAYANGQRRKRCEIATAPAATVAAPGGAHLAASA
jgi:hypothetical protein